ncbi:unnamed protein product [Rotaria sp. Silwood2]|nr:unnamed protein product [Rotaria sp. Silwood2]CAF4533076.1 unnamed protein product [Rotaria sp. Silwood2]
MTCSKPLLWTQAIIDTTKPQLYAYIIVSFMHLILWLQISFSSPLRQKIFLWIYSYLFTDIFLLFRFLFSYIIHTTSTECQPSREWVLFNCYFEATLDNYFNITEIYILLALNICRYVQIAYNRNVYHVHMKLLIFTQFCIYLIPLVVLIGEFLVGWTQIKYLIRGSCEVFYTNIYVQIFNTIFAYALPMFLNMLMIYASIHHVHLISVLQGTQHHVSACEKYHRSLVIQFLCFYFIWGVLWSPYVILFQLSLRQQNVMNVAMLLSFMEIACDSIIVAALDVRFWHQWRKLGVHVKNTIFVVRCNRQRIHPSTVNLN